MKRNRRTITDKKDTDIVSVFPYDVWFHIIDSFLSIDEVVGLACVCKFFKSTVDHYLSLPMITNVKFTQVVARYTVPDERRTPDRMVHHRMGKESYNHTLLLFLINLLYVKRTNIAFTLRGYNYMFNLSGGHHPSYKVGLDEPSHFHKEGSMYNECCCDGHNKTRVISAIQSFVKYHVKMVLGCNMAYEIYSLLPRIKVFIDAFANLKCRYCVIRARNNLIDRIVWIVRDNQWETPRMLILAPNYITRLISL